MKRKGKVIFLSISVIILLVIIFNFNEIKFGLNMAKSYNQAPKEEKELTENEKELLEGSSNPLLVILEKEGIVVESESDEEVPDSNNENDKDKDEDNKTENKKENETDYTKTIVKYNNEFSSLQSEFESKLGGLVSQGYSEYKSGTSPGKLAPKYLSKGADLEGECDRKFYTMLGELEDELNASKQDTGVISDLKNYYNSYKDAKRGEIMNKAKGHL